MPQTPIAEGDETLDIMCDKIDLTPEDEAALEAGEERRGAAYTKAKAGAESEADENEDETADEDGQISEDRMDRFTWRNNDIKWL